MITKPTLPVILTELDWKKKKGVFAKAGGKTGISEAMRVVKVSFDKVKWDAITTKAALRKLGPDIDLDGLAGLERDYKAARGGLVTLHKALTQLEITAGKTFAAYKKNPLIPAATLKHVEKLVKETNLSRRRWAPTLSDKGWAEMLTQFRTSVQANEARIQDILKTCTTIEAFLDRVQATPTAAVFNAGRAPLGGAIAELIEDIEALSAMAQVPRPGQVKPFVGRDPGLNGLTQLRQNYPDTLSREQIVDLVTRARSSVGSVRLFARPR